MTTQRLIIASAAFSLLLLAPVSASAMSVEISTQNGHDAVYKPGEAIDVSVRSSDDAYLLIYEIDAEGTISVLFPFDVRGGLVEGGRSYRLSEERPDFALVVQEPVGQGYLVAITSRTPFKPLPWYLRPFDPQAAELGYEGATAEETEGVTEDGRIVGDPFVAMERIRRSVLENPDDPNAFATSYTGYYVHHQVNYPRYLCNDCHRPEYWSWWPGFDPYYATCSVFTVRVNYGWAWGPSYWFGTVPYYVYSWVPGCAPGYVVFPTPYVTSWYGWGSWQRAWGMRRYKTPPPPGYDPPSKYDGDFRRRDLTRSLPPGFMAGAHQLTARGGKVRVPVGSGWRSADERGGNGSTLSDGNGRTRTPRGGRNSEPSSTPERNIRRAPAARAPSEGDVAHQSRSFDRRGQVLRPSPSARAPQSDQQVEFRRPARPSRETQPAPAKPAPQSDSPQYSAPSGTRSPSPGGGRSGPSGFGAPSRGAGVGGASRSRR